MFNIKIIDDSRTTITREHTEPAWDGDDTYTDHYIRGFYASEKGYGDVYREIEPEYNRPYYLVYALYDTGDSFHRDENVIAFVELYDTYEEAKKTIEILNQSGENDFSIKIPAYNGREMTYSCPWKGYFERLRAIEVALVERKSD